MKFLRFLGMLWFAIVGLIVVPLIIIDKIYISFVKTVIFIGLIPNLVMKNKNALELYERLTNKEA